LVSFSGTFVETPAGRVFVHRRGQGAPLVLLHGYMMSHWYFHAVLPRLADTYDVVAIDLPGFGESDRPSPDHYPYDLGSFAATAGQVLATLGIARASVVGHSMGGGVALTLAARHPERVERLVLVDALCYPPPDAAVARLLSSRVGPLLWRHLVTRTLLARRQRSDVKDPSVITDEHVDYYYERFTRGLGREAAYATLRALFGLSMATADPGRVRAPTLLLWGEDDRMVPLSLAKRLHRAIPGAELRVIPVCGHTPFLERPDEFLREVGPFLDRLDQEPVQETGS
jgi:pimeloyl-ACP methyl ester carboxylesterase